MTFVVLIKPTITPLAVEVGFVHAGPSGPGTFYEARSQRD
jgi:hypothetical protein